MISLSCYFLTKAVIRRDFERTLITKKIIRPRTNIIFAFVCIGLSANRQILNEMCISFGVPGAGRPEVLRKVEPARAGQETGREMEEKLI